MRFFAAWTAPSTLYGMPPTGPTVPSGLIVPVIVMSGLIVSPRSSAMTATVISVPALGPSMRPRSWNVNCLPETGEPVRRVATVTALHAAARHSSPVPATSSSEKLTRSDPSGEGPTATSRRVEMPFGGVPSW